MVSADPAGGGSRGAKCPRCGRVGTLAGKRVRPWFTLFFLPLFPMGAGRAITQCKGCGATFAASVRELGRAVERADGRQAQRAISLYNSLRASPANSVTLNELMGLHLSLGEPEQAVNAAADFVDALNASEQCMTTLGRAYGVAGKTDDAIHWFDAGPGPQPRLWRGPLPAGGGPDEPDPARPRPGGGERPGRPQVGTPWGGGTAGDGRGARARRWSVT